MKESGGLLEMERQLARMEKQISEVQAIAKLGFWELDLINNELHWSDEIYNIFGVTKSGITASYETFLNYIHPDDRDLVDKAYSDSVANKTPYGPIIHRVITEDGELKYVEERGTTTYNPDGDPIRSVGVVQDVTERVNAEKTQRDLKEKELLIKEIHHRVKNNLQIISSLLSLQSYQLKDPVAIEKFDECRDRIKAISLVHEQLYMTKNLHSIPANLYIEILVQNLKSAVVPNGKIEFKIDVTEEELEMDESVSLGILLNEIITNAMKHAFEEGQKGVIEIKMDKNENGWDLFISDDGKGVEDPAQLKNDNSLGGELIETLADQMQGKLDVTSHPGSGVKYHLHF